MAAVGDLSRRGFGGRRLAPPRRLLAALSDERLAERLRQGDRVAFELLYDRHHRSLLGFCRNILRSHEEAEDAVQQVFMSAYRALTEREHRPRHIKPWLYTIGRNRCLSMIRSRKEDVRPVDDGAGAPDPPPSEKAEEHADLSALVSDLRNLPEAQRTALVLTELGGLPHSQVAQVLDCQQGKVRALVFQARASLIDQREAREASCPEIREEIANLTGSRLRGRARRHAKSCAACAGFAEEVRHQRRALALALPIIPSLGLKQSLLAALMGGGDGVGGKLTNAGAGLGAGAVAGAAGAGSAATGGGATAGAGFLALLTTKVGLTKAAAMLVAATSVATGMAAGDKDPGTSGPSGPRTAAGAGSSGEVTTPRITENGATARGVEGTNDDAVPPPGETDGKAEEGVEHRAARLHQSESPRVRAAPMRVLAAQEADPSRLLEGTSPEAPGISGASSSASENGSSSTSPPEESHSVSQPSQRGGAASKHGQRGGAASKHDQRGGAASKQGGTPVANTRHGAVPVGKPESPGRAEIAKDHLAKKLNKARIGSGAGER